MAFQHEREPRKDANNILNKIKADVIAGIKLTPEVPQQDFIDNFNKTVLDRKAQVVGDITPPGYIFRILSAIKGEEFYLLSCMDRAKMAIQIKKMPYVDQCKIVSEKMRDLYDRYRLSDPNRDSKVAWRKFVQTSTLLAGPYPEPKGFDIRMPDYEFNEFRYIDIPPGIITYHSIPGEKNFGSETEYLKNNTKLQENIARSLGILKPHETWAEFTHKDNIVVDFGPTDRLRAEKSFLFGPKNEKTLLDSKKIRYHYEKWEARETPETSGSLGAPFTYDNVPTKHAQIMSTITFDCLGNYLVFKEPLDKYIQNGIISPQIYLTIPTIAFV
jgi:hypothetical protein